MTTRTSFPQRGQRISTSEPLSPLHNLYPHIGQDTYIFIWLPLQRILFDFVQLCQILLQGGNGKRLSVAGVNLLRFQSDDFLPRAGKAPHIFRPDRYVIYARKTVHGGIAAKQSAVVQQHLDDHEQSFGKRISACRMERQRHVAELSHRRDCPRLRREAIVFRNPVQCEGLHGHPYRHDDARQILRQYR